MKRFGAYLNEARLPNRVTVYHGSKNRITGFDASFLVGGTDQKGPGLYCSTDIDDASRYGPHLHQIELDAETFLKPDAKVHPHRIIKLVKQSPHLEDALSNWDENQSRAMQILTNNLLEHSDNMLDALQTVWFDVYAGDNLAFLGALEKNHYYGGAVVYPNKFNQSTRHYIVWSGRWIKSISII